MTPASEQEARQQIDQLLEAAGWQVQDASAAHIHAAPGVAIREFPLPGHGFADYLLYVDGKAAGVIEAKKAGATLTGVEVQSARYTQGLPPGLPRWHNPLPFCYESTGVETRFTNGLDPEPRSRTAFASLDAVLARILAAMQPGREYARVDLAEPLGLTTGQWNAAIQELKRVGKVRQVGEKRGARYVLSRTAGGGA